jgi:hypothetical protein
MSCVLSEENTARRLVTYSLDGRRHQIIVCCYEATLLQKRVEKSQVKHWNISTLPGGICGGWPLAYCTWGAGEAGREVEGTAPPRIEAPTPGTKFPSGPVEALQHPLYTLDAAGKSESTVTIVGPSREGVRARRNVPTQGLSSANDSAATGGKRVVTGGPFSLSYVLLLFVVGSLWFQALKNGNCNCISSESDTAPETDKCVYWCANDAIVTSREYNAELLLF